MKCALCGPVADAKFINERKLYAHFHHKLSIHYCVNGDSFSFSINRFSRDIFCLNLNFNFSFVLMQCSALHIVCTSAHVPIRCVILFTPFNFECQLKWLCVLRPIIHNECDVEPKPKRTEIAHCTLSRCLYVSHDKSCNRQT